MAKSPAKKTRTFGQALIQAAKEAIAFARGELDPTTYRVHYPKKKKKKRKKSRRQG